MQRSLRGQFSGLNDQREHGRLSKKALLTRGMIGA
jgi:hypothetical protein